MKLETGIFSKASVVLLSILILGQQDAKSEPGFYIRIPNGNINTCYNCHYTSTGGKASLNQFGKDFFENYKSWDKTLALLDSDNDGFSNGFELQDSLGNWQFGSIGDSNKVTLPGDPSSFPTSIKEITNNIEISIQPIPAISSINFLIKNSTANNIIITIFDINGCFVNSFTQISPSENINISWNLLDSKSNPIESGVYFIEVKLGNYSERRRFVVSK